MPFKDQCLYWHNYFRTLHQVNRALIYLSETSHNKLEKHQTKSVVLKFVLHGGNLELPV